MTYRTTSARVRRLQGAVCLWAAALFCGGLLACSDSGSGGGPGMQPDPTPVPDGGMGGGETFCTSEAECMPGEICEQGLCKDRPECAQETSDADCPPTHSCNGLTRKCELREGLGNECEENTDCGLGLFCDKGLCKSALGTQNCASNLDCPDDHRCSRGVGLCVVNLCFIDDHCSEGEVCNREAQACTEQQGGCETDMDCDVTAIRPFCSPAKACVQCRNDEDCGVVTGVVCHEATGECRGQNSCSSDEDCTAPSTCSDVTQTCVLAQNPCFTSSDCEPGFFCDPTMGMECQPIPCDADRLEPNESFDAASEATQQTYTELRLCPVDEDWYFIDATRGQQLQVEVNAFFDIEVFFGDADTLVARGVRTAEATADEDGRFYVKVFGGEGDYALTFDFGQGMPCDPDANEPNNDSDSAAALSVEVGSLDGQTICPGDSDWYDIELSAGTLLEVGMFIAAPETDLDMELIDAQGEVVTRAAGREPSESMSYNAAVDGSFKLRVYSLSPTARTSYDLVLTVGAGFSCRDDRLEPNDSAGTAAVVEPGELTEMILCGEDADWYRVSAVAGKELVAEVEALGTTAGLKVAVWDASGSEELASDSRFSGSDVATRFRVETDGDYLISVTAEPRTQASYSLLVGVEEPCGTDALEPNDESELAAPVVSGIYSLALCGGDTDWFFVEARAEQVIDFNIEFSHSDMDIDMKLYGADGEDVLERSTGVQDNETFSHRAESDEPLLLEVYTFRSTFRQVPYTLTINGLCADDALEGSGNGDRESAVALLPGEFRALQLCEDEDWYSFVVEGETPKTVTVTTRFIDEEGDVDIWLYRGEGEEPLIRAETKTDDETLSFNVEPGVYYLRVFIEEGQRDRTNRYGMTFGLE